MTSNWINGQVLLGHGVALAIAAAGLLAIGALLFHWRRTRTRTLARKLQP